MSYAENITSCDDPHQSSETENPLQVRGRISSAVTQGPSKLSYFIYRPRHRKDREQVVFSIHGYTRNALQHMFVLQDYAEEKGVAIVVPHFTKREFRRYQQVRPHRNGACPNIAFMELIQDLEVTNAFDLSTIRAVGYSGGGQFLHRLAMLQPDLIDRLVLFAPGWYTMPDRAYPYPLGLGQSPALGDRSLSLEGFRKADVLVLVGDKDIGRNDSLNKHEDIDLAQGRTRVARAQNWTRTMNASLPFDNQIKLQLLKGLRHGFRKNFEKKGYGQLVFDHLLLDLLSQNVSRER